MAQYLDDNDFWTMTHPTEVAGTALAIVRAWIDHDFDRLWVMTREVDARLLLASLLGPMTSMAERLFDSREHYLAFMETPPRAGRLSRYLVALDGLGVLSVVGAPERACTKCSEVLPYRAFAKDTRAKSGIRAVCRRCDRRATRVRRARSAVADLATVPQPTPPVRPARDPADLMVTACETTIGALNPPAGDLDAVLVLLLRSVAELADRAIDEGDVTDLGRCGSLLLRILRELLATRAVRPPPPGRSKLDHFRPSGY